MRRILTALCASVLALCTTSPGIASDSVTFDGVWWQGLSETQQLAALQGMLVGYEANSDMVDEIFASKGMVELKVLEKIQKRLPASKVGVHITFGSIQSKITTFYVDHPEKIKSDVSTIFACAATIDCSPRAIP